MTFDFSYLRRSSMNHHLDKNTHILVKCYANLPQLEADWLVRGISLNLSTVFALQFSLAGCIKKKEKKNPTSHKFPDKHLPSYLAMSSSMPSFFAWDKTHLGKTETVETHQRLRSSCESALKGFKNLSPVQRSFIERLGKEVLALRLRGFIRHLEHRHHHHHHHRAGE